MALCNIGKIAKNEVKLCYVADEYLLNSLTQVQHHRQEDGFILFRTTSKFSKHCFTVHWGEFGNHSEPIARMYFSYTVVFFGKSLLTLTNHSVEIVCVTYLWKRFSSLNKNVVVFYPKARQRLTLTSCGFMRIGAFCTLISHIYLRRVYCVIF